MKRRKNIWEYLPSRKALIYAIEANDRDIWHDVESRPCVKNYLKNVISLQEIINYTRESNFSIGAFDIILSRSDVNDYLNNAPEKEVIDYLKKVDYQDIWKIVLLRSDILPSKLFKLIKGSYVTYWYLWLIVLSRADISSSEVVERARKVDDNYVYDMIFARPDVINYLKNEISLEEAKKYLKKPKHWKMEVLIMSRPDIMVLYAKQENDIVTKKICPNANCGSELFVLEYGNESEQESYYCFGCHGTFEKPKEVLVNQKESLVLA